MERTDQDFVDGLALDLFAPSNRTAIVTQNFSPLSATFVQGSSGEPFVPVSNYSYVIKMSDPTPDLVAKVELPYDPAALEAQGLNPSNTYVGKLNSAGNAWMVSEAQRNVHVTENKTRIIKLTSLDGEYRLLARATADTSNIFLQYGDGATRTFNLTGGAGIQEAEFVDGLRLAVRSPRPLRLNAALASGVDPAALPAGTRSLYSFRWAVNVSDPAAAVDASVRFPVNVALLNASADAVLARELTVGRRELGAVAKRYQMVDDGAVAVELAGAGTGASSFVVMAGLRKLDGEYVVLKAEKPLRGGAAQQQQQAGMASGASAAAPGTRGALVYWQLAAVALGMFLR
ncbi:putative paired amphipathic helix protein sin3a protein [Neofusicoccum parvum UCRNP2]|uniref:Putative paired amphipathic helix protein sin3a protein n=1 Tax=Botryosphaeria parva (strain UCR-NP2) TaxID=1287680 RepID=R1EVF7_BOTPV|nr:putative paired amphipathic helix protein sin3a protein [Neofusicoccum parvum UCRNP2]